MHIYKYSYLRATALKTFTCSRNFNKHYHLAQARQTATRLTKNKLYSYIVFVNSFTLVFICWFIFKHWIPFCAINFQEIFSKEKLIRYWCWAKANVLVHLHVQKIWTWIRGSRNAANDNTLTIISISCVKSMKMGH